MTLKNLANKFETKYSVKKASVTLDHSKIAPNATEVCRMLQEKGFSAYLVGGCVRDLFLGGTPKDWDIATNAKPEQTKEIFPKTYDTGLAHGTITVSMGPTVADHFEVTTYRTEGDYTDGRRPDSVAFVDDIEADLARRDLTMNAMAYDPVNNKIIDPFGGLKDLEAKSIKAVGDPNERFAEDGLRTMRVARFAARFGFTVDPATQEAIKNNLPVLAKVSKERMRDELTKTLMTSQPSVGLNILHATGALSVLGPAFISPSLPSTFPQIDACKGAMETKVAVLLHNDAGSVEKTLRELKFSNTESKRVMFCVAAAKEFSKFAGAPSGLEARRFLAYVKNMGPEGFDRSLHEFFTFAEATHLNQLDQLKSMLHEKSISRKELDISGNDLMTTLNVAPGPKIKSILDSLYNEVLHNPELNEKSKLLELAAKFEKMAFTALTESRTKKAAPDWWRLSPGEEKDLLNKEYDFGNGTKFRVGDIPELASQVEVPAGPEQHHPEKNQLLHNNMVYDKAREISEDPMVWFAAALHDLGKSYTDKTKWPKQHGHEVGGVPFVERVSDLLGVSPEWKEFASIVAENHLKCHTSQQLTPKVLKKLFDLFKNDKNKFNAFLTSCEADAQGRMGGYADKPYEQKPYLSQKWDEGFPVHKNQSSDLALSGNDLMQELGLKPGQELGKILKTIKEMVEADPMLNDRETLLGIAKNLLIK